MKHIIGVAEECYRLAKNKYNLGEFECRRAFMIGYLHDVGYQFSTVPSEHPKVGYDLLKSLGIDVSEILNHGDPSVDQSMYLEILNTADLTVNSVGEKVSMEERLEDIALRHGTDSDSYKNPAKLVRKLRSEDEFIKY